MISLLKRTSHQKQKKSLSVNDIPGPKGKLFIGDALAFDADRITWMLKTKAEFGDIVRLDSETIFVHDPELIHYIMAKTNDIFMLDNAMISGRNHQKILDNGLSQWMQSRKYLNKGLHHKIIKTHIHRASVALQNSVDELCDQDFDLFDVSQRLLGRAIADFCIGADKQFEEIFRAIEDVFWVSLDIADAGESRLPWSPRPIAKKGQQLNKKLIALLDRAVQRRKTLPPEETELQDALDQLIINLDQAPEQQLVAAVRLMMVTAHGPSGALFSWCLLRLAQRPDLVSAIRDEMKTDMPIGNMSRDFPVTLSVIKETMRMHPPTWLMGRTTKVKTRLAAYTLPENCRILFSPYVVHHDSRFWQKPEQFLPERWTKHTPQPYTQAAYFPFGGGPRVCPGAMLGPIQIALGLNAVLTHYDIHLPPLDEVVTSHSTLLRPKEVTAHWTRR